MCYVKKASFFIVNSQYQFARSPCILPADQSVVWITLVGPCPLLLFLVVGPCPQLSVISDHVLKLASDYVVSDHVLQAKLPSEQNDLDIFRAKSSFLCLLL